MRPLLLLALTAAVAPAAPIPKEFREKRPNYFPMAVGDKREYADPSDPTTVTQTRTITAVEEKGGARYFTQEISTGQKTVLKVDKTGVFVVSSGGLTYDPPYKAVGPDMKPGDKWECGDANGMIRSIGRAEKVTTPAGNFTAFPVAIEYSKFPDSGTQVLWYAEGHGMVRYDSGGMTTLVLTKFTPGKEKK